MTRDAVAPRGDDHVRSPFALVLIHDLDDVKPDGPQFAWQGLVPFEEVTIFSAHGGGGKTQVMLMLAIAASVGRPLFGIPTRQTKVCFLSAEEGSARMRHRVHFTSKAMNVSMADLDNRLFILDATEGDPVLFTEVTFGAGRREGMTTPSFETLRQFVVDHEIGLLIVDNASDVFDADEIKRARVRAFMRALANLGRECGTAVVLLAHVDKGTSRGERIGTESYSGSTAWHNSARSRMFMHREKDGSIVIEHQKNNLGPLHAPIHLVWPEGGLPMVDEPFGPVVQGIADRAHEKALLKLIAEYTQRGEYITAATTSRTHAAKVMRNEPTFPHIQDSEVFDLLRRAERDKHLERVTIKADNRHEKECWRVTPGGAKFAGIAALTAPTALTLDVDALDADSARQRADCADFAQGVIGGKARAPGSTH
jgi:hypothetical protein